MRFKFLFSRRIMCSLHPGEVRIAAGSQVEFCAALLFTLDFVVLFD